MARLASSSSVAAVLILYIPSSKVSNDKSTYTYVFPDGATVTSSTSWDAVRIWVTNVRPNASVNLQELDTQSLIGDPFSVAKKIQHSGAKDVYVDITRGNRKYAMAVTAAVSVLRNILPDVNITLVHAGIHDEDDRTKYYVTFFDEVYPATLARWWYRLDLRFIDVVEKMINQLSEKRKDSMIKGDKNNVALHSTLEKSLGYAKKIFLLIYYGVFPDNLSEESAKHIKGLLNANTGDDTLDARLRVVGNLLQNFFVDYLESGSQRIQVSDHRILYVRFYVMHGHAHRAIVFSTELLKSFAKLCIEHPALEYGHVRQLSEILHAKGHERDNLIRIYAKQGCADLLREIISALDLLVQPRNTLAHGADPAGRINAKALSHLPTQVYDKILEIYRVLQQKSLI